MIPYVFPRSNQGGGRCNVMGWCNGIRLKHRHTTRAGPCIAWSLIGRYHSRVLTIVSAYLMAPSLVIRRGPCTLLASATLKTVILEATAADRRLPRHGTTTQNRRRWPLTRARNVNPNSPASASTQTEDEAALGSRNGVSLSALLC